MATTEMIKPDKFPPVERDGVTFQVDRHGFPVERCGRCGGSGTYSFCQMYGDTCFGCSGVGLVYAAKKPAEERAAWRKDLAGVTRARRCEVQAGDRIRELDAPKGSPFRTVAAVALGEPDGWEKIGSAPQEVTSWRTTITFDDGTTEESMGSVLVRRAGTVDPSPYVERAQVAMVAKLRRRARTTTVRSS